ncbi:MAG: ABC transporter permease [Arcobacteraceae bacterium]|jgi:phospholipid/cholesterol/gamma-HCH transport system permease protein|nr:ABC transporter permease [Arcobacteraceae bacterium]
MSTQALYKIEKFEGVSQIKCSGEWTKQSVDKIFDKFGDFVDIKSNIVCDITDIEKFDTAGAMAILHIKRAIEEKKLLFSIQSNNEKNSNLIDLCSRFSSKNVTTDTKQASIKDFFYALGKQVHTAYTVFIAFINFLGGVTLSLFGSILNPNKFRFKATLFHIEQNGLYAVPIIVITSLLIGVVLAYQGAVQLQQFGANIFIVEMIGISATRELAPLIAAIVIAGRTASAFTAQIGVMKLTDEIDAMKTMGFRTWEFVILPRVVAMMIVLPLLVVVADSVTIFGGMIIADIDLGISYVEFMDRFRETVAMKHILIGLIKAPFFGIIIALVGCFRGFLVESNTQSVGKYTTISVVNAIFWVIAFNAIFSIVLTKMGI